MTNYEAIKLLIEEEIRGDNDGNLYGHEHVAEYLADRFNMLQKRIDDLEETVKLVVDTYDNGGWPDAVITIARGAIGQDIK
jgi:hypothetical protein